MAYVAPRGVRPVSLMLSSFSYESPLSMGARQWASTFNASTAYPTANLAIYVPVIVPQAFTAVKAFVSNGATAAGNWDIGIYDEAWARISSTTQQAQAGTGAVQSFDITDFTIPPGRYYLAFSSTSTSATFISNTCTDTVRLATLGCAQEASAGTLPATATPAVCTTTIVPVFGFSRRTLV